MWLFNKKIKGVDLYAKAKANYDAKEYGLAIKDIDFFIINNNNNTSALILRGMIKLNLHLYKEAISDFNKAILLCSTEANWYFLRASAFIKLKDWTSARSDVEKAYILEPEQSIYENYLSMIDIVIAENIEMDFDEV